MANEMPAEDRGFFDRLCLEPAQHEAIALLGEECGELVQILGKILRHGLDSAHPESGEHNTDTLHREVGDVLAALRIAEVQGLLNWEHVIRYRDKKLMKVQKYLHHAKVHADD